ncbi:MAG TPA: alpha/beta hydrolase [Solirubrobacteraceae bacterium]|jgi:pimeloyl-ACP methyl ester carboxylesterase
MEFRTVTHAGRSHVVAQAGDGPDIVLLHGFPDTPCSWAEIQAALIGAGWRVTVPWLRGYHPETIVPGRRYDPESLGRDVLALLDALDISETVVVGHDWGALLAYVAATLAPERVRAIVTVGIPHPSVLRRTPRAMWEVRHFVGLKLPWAAWSCRRNDFAYLGRLYRRWSPAWSGPERDETLRHAKQALSSPATLDGVISYYRDLPLGGSAVAERVPTVPGLIVGSDHGISSGELFVRTAERLAQPSRALIVEGAGHWPHRENATVVIPELLSFLARLDA